MAQIEVTVNGRNYEIACDDGQEAHIARLAEYLDKRVAELVSAIGQVGDSRLLVMVSLLIADELAETYAGLKKAQAEAAPSPTVGEVEDRLAELVNAAADRIESLTAELSKTG